MVHFLHTWFTEAKTAGKIQKTRCFGSSIKSWFHKFKWTFGIAISVFIFVQFIFPINSLSHFPLHNFCKIFNFLPMSNFSTSWHKTYIYILYIFLLSCPKREFSSLLFKVGLMLRNPVVSRSLYKKAYYKLALLLNIKYLLLNGIHYTS